VLAAAEAVGGGTLGGTVTMFFRFGTPDGTQDVQRQEVPASHVVWCVSGRETVECANAENARPRYEKCGWHRTVIRKRGGWPDLQERCVPEEPESRDDSTWERHYFKVKSRKDGRSGSSILEDY